jgi:hypothetical protein
MHTLITLNLIFPLVVGGVTDPDGETSLRNAYYRDPTRSELSHSKNPDFGGCRYTLVSIDGWKLGRSVHSNASLASLGSTGGRLDNVDITADLIIRFLIAWI